MVLEDPFQSFDSLFADEPESPQRKLLQRRKSAPAAAIRLSLPGQKRVSAGTIAALPGNDWMKAFSPTPTETQLEKPRLLHQNSAPQLLRSRSLSELIDADHPASRSSEGFATPLTPCKRPSLESPSKSCLSDSDDEPDGRRAVRDRSPRSCLSRSSSRGAGSPSEPSSLRMSKKKVSFCTTTSSPSSPEKDKADDDDDIRSSDGDEEPEPEPEWADAETPQAAPDFASYGGEFDGLWQQQQAPGFDAYAQELFMAGQLPYADTQWAAEQQQMALLLSQQQQMQQHLQQQHMQMQMQMQPQMAQYGQYPQNQGWVGGGQY